MLYMTIFHVSLANAPNCPFSNFLFRSFCLSSMNRKTCPKDCAIARLFNVSVDYLVGLSDMPTPANSSRVLPLPSNFPSDLLPELKDYAEFLSYKAAQHTKSKNMVNADSKKKE